MHVGIARQEAEYRQFEKPDGVQTGGVGILAERLSELFHGAVVFLGGHFVEDLAEVLHVKHPAAFPVHPARYVGEFAGFERDEPGFRR